jgi:hypothetical protein
MRRQRPTLCLSWNWSLTLQLAHPVSHRKHVSSSVRACYSPGLFAPQSAHVPFPGTVLISSCSALSLRACWRLFSADAIFFF